MSDTTINKFVASGTEADRGSFTPSPPSVAAPPDSGYFYFCTDSGLAYSWDAGMSAWVPVGGGGGAYPSFVTPVNGSYTWVNQGGASVTVNGNGGIALLAPLSSSLNLRLRVMSAPATPYTVTAAFLSPALSVATIQEAGLCFRDSGSGKIHAFFAYASSATGIASTKFTDATTFSADYIAQLFTRQGVTWFRIQDDGTNRICSYSADGYTWIVFSTIGRTDFLTANQVGFFANEQTNTYQMSMTLLSWDVT